MPRVERHRQQFEGAAAVARERVEGRQGGDDLLRVLGAVDVGADQAGQEEHATMVAAGSDELTVMRLPDFATESREKSETIVRGRR